MKIDVKGGKYLATFLCVFGLFGCARKLVFKSDLDAWKGASIRDLQLHPRFSLMRPTGQRLGNGDILLTYYTNCTGGGTSCMSVGSSYRGINIASQSCGRSEVVCCGNQFLIRGNRVLWYRLVGRRCYTNCSLRPKAKQCDVSEEDDRSHRSRYVR